MNKVQIVSLNEIAHARLTNPITNISPSQRFFITDFYVSVEYLIKS